MKRFVTLSLLSLLVTGCSTVGTINWTEDGAYCFDTADSFWKFDKAVEAFDLISIQSVIDAPSTALLPQGTKIKVLVEATNAVSPAKVEVLEGSFDGTICWTYQGAVEE